MRWWWPRKAALQGLAVVAVAATCVGPATAIRAQAGGVLARGTGMDVTPTATLAPTQTPIPTPVPTAAPPSATAAPPVAALTAGPQAPGVLALRAVGATAGGAHGTISQGVQVLIPASAVTSTIALRVRLPALGQVPELTGGVGEQNNAGVGWAFDLDATNAATGQAVHQFDPRHPLILQFTYDPTQVAGIDPTLLRVCYFDGPSGDWRLLPTTVDTFNDVLTATTDHLTLFAVRATAATQAQITKARARLAALAAAGPPRVSVLPVAQTTLGGTPLVVTVPVGRRRAPLALQVTGEPHAQVQVTYTLAGGTTVQTLALDDQGYATTAFAPATALARAQSLRVTVTVTRAGAQAVSTQTVTLLPGPAAGGAATPGAPWLGATLSADRVKRGAAGPLVTVTTAAGATVRAALWVAGRPLAGLAAVPARADRRGAAHLQLPPLPATLAVGAQDVQAVVTATLHGDSTQISLPLVVVG